MLPSRIRHKSTKDRRRFPAHCNFVRDHACCACGSKAAIEVAHVRTGTDGGMGMKPGDWWTISLCHDCHARQHNIGEASFEAENNIDMKELARAFVKASPKRRDLEAARDA
jgi:hypothetical protein